MKILPPLIDIAAYSKNGLSFEQLHSDLFLLIIRRLSLQDVLRLLSCSKTLYNLRLIGNPVALTEIRMEDIIWKKRWKEGMKRWQPNLMETLEEYALRCP